MFGFLKQKIASFGEKLKQTIGGKAERPSQEEEKKAEEVKKEEIKETKKEEVKEQKKEEVKEQKKEEAKEQKKEDKKQPQKKEEPKKEEKKKKTREEEAEELEKKMFEEINAELEEEGLTETNDSEVKEEKREDIAPRHEHEKREEKLEVKESALGESRRDRHRKEKEEKEFRKEEKKTDTPTKGIPKIEAETEEERVEEEKALEEAEAELENEEETKEKTEQVESVAEEVAPEKETEEEGSEAAEAVEEAIEEEKEEDIEYDKRIEEKRAELKNVEIKSAEEDKRSLKAKVGLGGKVKGFLFGGIEISEKDIEELLYELELSLLESDVEQDAAKELVAQIKKRLIGTRASPKNLDEFIKQQIKEILAEMMSTNKINLLEEVKKAKKEGKTFRILMLGPNGAGKTTSIAKLAKYFEKNKMTTLFAAGDTFRAAAIDQLEEHAKRLGVRVVKQQYGADPAAVAFDAIKAAEAAKIDVVIIDSAGRQETNKNLMEELKKLERVAKPNLKLYVGEAYAGQGLLDQAKEFEDMVGIDGFILTKIDTDAKGGTSISLLYKLKKPILFVGTGQEYENLEEFTPEFILNRII